jgi:hypothetical protein
VKLFFLLLFGTLISTQSLYADEQIFEGTKSPHGLCIEQVTPGGLIRFFDPLHHKTLGDIFPHGETDWVNIGFECSWSPEEDKVAVLFSYGTKLNDILLYEKSHGVFKEVKFDLPESAAVYKQIHKKSYKLEFSEGVSDNALGPWIDDDTIDLISGDTKDVYNKDFGWIGTSSLLVVLRVRIQNEKATTLTQKLIGPLSEAKRDAFFDKWGDNYQ